jgi:hypothetical protein
LPELLPANVADNERWIWIDGDEAPRNAVDEFRKNFRIAESGSYRLRISADSRYTLWLNGKLGALPRPVIV